MDYKNPLKLIDPLTGMEMTMQPPMPANQMGTAQPVFNQNASNAASMIYGTPLQRQMSMPKPPMFMKDIPEGSDGAGLRALDDSVVEQMGYDSATKMVSPLNDNHPGDKKMLKTLTKKKPQPYTKEQLQDRNKTIKQAYGITKDGKQVNLGNITSTEISEKDFKQR